MTERSNSLICLNVGVCQGRISIEKPSEPKTLSFDVCEITRLLGITVPNSEIVSILYNLHIDTTIDSNGTASCIIPQYREDIERPCDIVEEIIRVYGYDKIKSTLLQNSHITKGGRTPHRLAVDKAKRILLGLGYNEIVTYSFGGKALYDKLSPKSNADLSKNIRIMNPLGEELSTMRTTLVAHMLDVVANNHSKNNYNFKLFEYGKAYIAHSLPLNELPDEDDLLSFCASERDFYEVKENLYDLFDIFGIEVKVQRSKKEFLHPGISVDFVVGSETIGFYGRSSPKVAANFDLQRDVVVGEINFNKLFALSNDSYKICSYSQVPRYCKRFLLW